MKTKSAPTYWQSLEHLADTPEVRQLIEQEFHGYDPKEMVDVPRRRFLKFMGASMALAGVTLTGCRRWPKEKLQPYSSAPKDRMPGVPEYYATVWELGGVSYPLLVTAFDGRPIKVDGNPQHPYSRKIGKIGAHTIGASDLYAQASILDIYDPERAGVPGMYEQGKFIQKTWDEANAALAEAFKGARANGGTGLAILSESTTSPSFIDMKARVAKLAPQAQWFEYEPLSRDNEMLGTKLAFGKPYRPQLQLRNAKVVVLFDADILGTHAGRLRYANDWAWARKNADINKTMNRVHLFESAFTITGTVADVRTPVKPSRIPALVASLAAKLGVAGQSAGNLSQEEAAIIDATAADLKAAGAGGLVYAGSGLAPEVHAVVAAINQALGAVGNTITYIDEPNGDRPSHAESIANLSKAIAANKVDTLLILGGNPAYDAPADLDLAKALSTVRVSIHHALHANETSLACKWLIPAAHYLEAWGDGRSWDGSISVAQPIIQPLYGGKSRLEMLAILAGEQIDGEAIVKRAWSGTTKDEKSWRKVLHDGFYENSAPPAAKVAIAGNIPAIKVTEEAKGFEVRFQQDHKIYDGRFANNGWLQETPDIMTKIVWDNAAYISKKDADELGVRNRDVLAVKVGGKSIEIAAYILPGQPVGVIGLPLGYGRSASGSIGTDLGFNTYSIRTSDAMFSAAAEVSKTGKTYNLVWTQEHHLIDHVGFEGRQERIGKKGESGSIVKEASLAAYAHDGAKAFSEGGHHGVPLQLFEKPDPNDFSYPHKWGMAIDTNACIGCNACVVACVAENNIPIVGKPQVEMNREMYWLRIDRYYKGAADDPNPQVIYQPMMCVHCENAPCEQVCPVAATLHDTEGLNVMVYNRCIGTRYCANNCPYKVRRFNYLDFQSRPPRDKFPMPWLKLPDMQQLESIDKIKQMVFNPEVTVRMRGVMEKCTYCIQRIHNTKVAKRSEGQELKDGDVVTACQQVCPTEAIVFGNLNDKESEVSKLHANPRSYTVLDELNTRARSKHMAKLRNPLDGSHEA
jgi:molybdopterin-containing oxidoreductase family iron-sulfur binding subunit